MSPSAAVLSFAREAQQEAPLRAAAYRMAGSASCEVDLMDGRWTCNLTTIGSETVTPELLKQRFLTVLNDENLREQIEQRTAPMRDIIVALAFGSLALSGKPAT